MRPEQRHLAMSFVWLFAAGIDEKQLDATGIPLSQSLALLIGQAEREGRREAATHYLTITQSGERMVGVADDTGKYDSDLLDQLLKASA